MNIPKYSKLFIQMVRETSVRETPVRESGCLGNVLSGNRLVRESSVRESDCPGNVRYPLLHYLGKLKSHKFAILMHVKHVSYVTFYHLSNRCPPNVMKLNVKVNTMQNTNILLFVRSLSLMY